MTFIHIPKTGGSSIEAQLSAQAAVFHRFPKPPSRPWLSPWHFPPDLFEARYRQTLKPPRFCVIRDPADRYRSCQAWSKNVSDTKFHLSASEVAVRALEWRKVTEELLHRLPQHMFIFSRSGHLQCECVVAFEKLGLLFKNGSVVVNKSIHKSSVKLPKDFANLYRFDTILHRAALSSRSTCFRPASNMK